MHPPTVEEEAESEARLRRGEAQKKKRTVDSEAKLAKLQEQITATFTEPTAASMAAWFAKHSAIAERSARLMTIVKHYTGERPARTYTETRAPTPPPV